MVSTSNREQDVEIHERILCAQLALKYSVGKRCNCTWAFSSGGVIEILGDRVAKRYRQHLTTFDIFDLDETALKKAGQTLSIIHST